MVDGDTGYSAFCPQDDRGVTAPTAALSAMPYGPAESLRVLRHFHNELGGLRDSFNRSRNWVAEGHLVIDQGPIVVMIENYRSGLMWQLFMSCPEVHAGLQRLGFAANRRRAVNA